MLNIVNNIKGLHMGKELRDFRTFTEDMDPLTRGDAIDSFDFVKHIHNSFARENDLLIADMHVKEKAAKGKKRRSLAKAKETRELKKAGKAPLSEQSPNVTTKPIRSSARTPKKTAKSLSSRGSTPLSDPPESDPEFESKAKGKANTKKTSQPTRRSQRQPKPRQSDFAASAAAEAEAEEGFHFVAYMPIDGHVWKLDGLDSFPEDMGAIDTTSGEDWMSIARPALQTRMLMYEGAEIEFNLMAVVHDPAMKQRQELIENVKELQEIDKKLDGLVEDWRTFDGAETKKDTIVASSIDFDISQADIDATELPAITSKKIKETEDLIELIEVRKEIIAKQAPLRGGIRDALVGAHEDDEKARHRRHDYGSFVRAWLGELAEEEVLSGLLDTS
jgi:ubiquitin carboxyl-terminal hydrolase L5